jgi:two-component system phosphate regulon response regulator PhoB
MGAPVVLIVDDDPDIRAMLGFALGDEFDVRFASGGEEAIAVLAAEPPDAMVLDLMMTEVDGYDVLLARRERGLAPAAYIVMLTCKTDERDLVRSWELGAHSFLSKPTDPEVIAQELRLHLAMVTR